MTFQSHRSVIRGVTWATMLWGAAAAEATVGPPVEIKMPRDTKAAVSGQEYSGVWEVHVYRAGALTDFHLEGQGWAIRSVEFPREGGTVPAGVVRIPFHAIPAEADQPIALSLAYNGRKVRQAYAIGPAYFADAGKPELSLPLPNTSGVRHPVGLGKSSQQSTEQPPGAPTRAGGIQVSGRIVYARSDGKVVGADRIDVRVLDNDTVGSEEMWSGLTDENGYFNGVASIPGDPDGSGPDLVLYFETSTADWVDVTDNSLLESTYSFESAETPNFGGSSFDFGWHTPADPALHPAIHIFNSITRARRFIMEKPGYVTPAVQVEWPDESMGGGAWYDAAANEIHVSTERRWREDTHTHEYGHHFMDLLYEPDPPDPDYCNGLCDDDPAAEDCGHCMWCEETDHDAFNEGWPNWLADVVTRDYPIRYQFNDGTPFEPLFTRDQETPEVCVSNFANVITTEGFIGALLRDLEDPGQDDHDDDPDPDIASRDGVFDLLCLGPNPNFTVIANHEPITVLDFIDGFRADFPQHTGRLFATAFNVGGAAYVSGFPGDAASPGVVPAMDSSTHPLGVGGSLPCITIEFDAAPDDATGACRYSAAATRNPAGVDPGESESPVSGTNDCRLTTVVPMTALGDWYISIKALDNDGNWCSQWATFGPFTVLDCNNTGLLDVCDIDCNSEGIPGCQIGGLCFSQAGSGCGTSPDCNANYIPDECDLSSGTSEDCNGDGIPDECQTAIIKHFTGGAGPGSEDQWELAENWLEGAPPVDGDHVCIPLGTPSTEVEFSEDFRRVATLNCDTDFRIQGSTPELRIDQPSYVNGDLTLQTTSTLRVLNSLDVGGELTWQGLEILGPGTVNVFGGFDLTSPVALPKLRNGAHLSILDGDVNIHGNEYVELYDTSTFSIGLPVTYSYDGNFNIFAGGPTTIVNVNGSLIRASGTLTATIQSFVLNSGLIHNRSGALTLFYGSTQSGFLLGDPETTIRLYATAGTSHTLLPSSILAVHDVTFGSGPCTIRGGVNIADALIIDSGTCTFTNEASVASYGQHLIVRAGSVRFEAPTTGPLVAFDTVTIGDLVTEGGKDARFNTGQPVSINTLSLVKGDIHGTDPITINDSFVWGTGGGWIFSGGAITCNGPATIQGNASSRYLNRVFNNAAYATFFGGFSSSGGGSFNNLATGTIDLRNSGTAIGLGTTSTLSNDGFLVKSAGTGVSSIFNHFRNTGTVEVQIGTLEFHGGNGMTHIQTAGETILNGGSLSVTLGAPYQIQGGDLTGSGAITAAVANSGGTVKPGLSAGQLSITGNYTQSAAAALEIEVGGLVPGVTHDRLAVSGTAALAGTLRAGLIGGFMPVVGEQFVILTAGTRTGTFAAVESLTPGLEVDVIYTPTTVTVEVISFSTAGDCDFDGDADLDDYGLFPGCLSGPELPYAGQECECIDSDVNGVIDLSDFAEFQAAYTG